MCRKPVESTGNVFGAFFHYKHNFTANNLTIKRRRKEELSKRITKLPCKIYNSKQRAK